MAKTEVCPGQKHRQEHGIDVKTLEHEWAITQVQGYQHGTGYVRETGIRCLWCSAEYVESEAVVIAMLVKRRAAAKRFSSKG